jgi:hypothetical protein
MAEFPAPMEGVVLTHFIVSSDVGRSRRFYAGVLGGEVLREGELPASKPAGRSGATPGGRPAGLTRLLRGAGGAQPHG